MADPGTQAREELREAVIGRRIRQIAARIQDTLGSFTAEFDPALTDFAGRFGSCDIT
jgi:hypothetical protein